MVREYVLLSQHPRTLAVTFVGGVDPRRPTLHPTRVGAARFPTVGEALAFRGQMANQPGASAYHVHQLLPDGRLMNEEP